MSDSDYLRIKHTLAASALVQAQSLPRELVRSRSGVNVPAPFPVREESKSDEIEVNANFDTNDFGYCEAWPDLSVPLVQTALTTPSPSANAVVIHSVHQTSAALAEASYGIASTHQTAMRDHGPVVGNAIRFTHTPGLAPAPAAVLSLDMEPYQYPMQIFVDFFAGGAWVLGGITFGGALGNSIRWDGVTVVVIPAGTQFVRTRVAVPPQAFLQKRRIAFDISIGTSALATDQFGFYTPAVVAWDVMINEAWPYLPQLPDIDRVRNLGYEALLTYTGSRQLDGGKIAGALVPFDWSPLADNPFDAVASVRHNKFSSALRSGAHGTWRVGALGELDPTSPELRSFPAMKLVFGYQRNNAENQSLRIRATGLFGVYSDSPIIGLAPFVPPLAPSDLDLLMEYFQTAPAVTENPLHEKLKSAGKFLSKAFHGVTNVAEKGIGMVANHPELASALALAAGQPEIAAGLEAYALQKQRVKAAAPRPAQPAARPQKPAQPVTQKRKGKGKA